MSLGRTETRMRKSLKIVLMASLTATTFLSTLFVARPARAESGGITASTDENGRKIYVNDGTAPRAGAGAGRGTVATRASSGGSGLVYWSSTEHRYKPVPTSGAVIRAARTAASEVKTYLDSKSQAPAVTAPPASTQSSLNLGLTSGGYSQQDIDAAIDEAAKRHGVDPNLVRSVVKVESNFNPNAVSRKGAMGLMQLMPATAQELGVQDPFDPAESLLSGARFLKQLLARFGGDTALALGAYNAGPGRVEESGGVPRIPETMRYVQQILSRLPIP